MVKRVTFELAFILHYYPYRNTSLLLEVFSLNYGRVALIARSARGPRSRFRGMLQLFTPILISWVGDGELKCVVDAELQGNPYELDGQSLLCGFYLNELIMRLLQRDDPYSLLFDAYRDTISAISVGQSLGMHLRYFEKKLLDELGYGLQLTHDAQFGQPILPDCRYQYIPEKGLVICMDFASQSEIMTYAGSSILALYEKNLCDNIALKEIKLLLRAVLAYYLGPKPLKSRELL